MAVEMRGVRYVDFGAQYAEEHAELMPLVEAVFERGDFIGGHDVARLEAEIAAYLGIEHVVTLNSGTDALVFALCALGIGRGDEVITAANSFVASAAAIAHIGATPVFADVLDDQTLDPAAVEAAIGPRTKALMPVHLTGRVADMDALGAIARKHGLAIIEDAAQAFGSKRGGRFAGTMGEIGAFSAHPLKNLNAAGDGGFVVTRDAALAERIRRLRNHGFRDRDTALEWGFVSRMDTVQAAVLRYRLAHVDGVIARRRANADRYRALLDRERAWFPIEAADQFNTHHLFVIQADHRDALARALADAGIETKVHYPTPIHLQPAAAKLGYAPGALPVTERQAGRILSLPINQFLTPDDIERVAGAINAYSR